MTDLDTRWNARMRLALAGKDVDLATADAVLDEVAQHCAATGESPEEAFGPAEEYAATVVRERIPPEARPEKTWNNYSITDHVSAALIQTGCFLLLLGPILWIFAGTMVPLTTATAVGAVTFLLALPSACLAYTLSGSRGRVAALWGAAALVLVILAAAAFTGLPTTDLFSFPAPAIIVVAIALIWRGFTLGEETTESSLLPPGGVSPTTDEGTESGTAMTTEEWMRALPEMLTERHGVPAARAAELAEEAASHLAATGGEAEEEFGRVDHYALHLADQEPTPRERWWLRDGVRSSGFGLAFLTVLFTSNHLSGGPVWLTVLGGAGVLCALGLFIHQVILWRRSSGSAER